MAASMNPDMLVIGGGPAGTSAAITCARPVLPVVLIEAAAFPRDRPGEALHPGVEPLLERLGVAEKVRRAGFLRHEGIWVERPGVVEFQRYGAGEEGPWLGFQAWRAEFDALLLAEAQSAGVIVYQPHRALRLLCQGERVTGASTSAGLFRAAFTVDASGCSAWLVRQLALPLRRRSRRLIALYGYMRGDCPDRDSAPHFAALPDGWLWTARVRPNLYHWTHLVRAGAAIGRAWGPREFSGLEPVGRVKGADVTWRRLESCAGPGYFVAGDAAMVLDPSSSHGVLRAIMSGMLAGHLVGREGSRFAPGPLVAREYRQFMESWFEFDSRGTAILAASPPSAGFDF